MTAPRRWLEPGSDAPAGARELLRAAAALPAMPPEVHGRILGSASRLAALPGVGAPSLLAFKVAATLAVGVAGALAAHAWVHSTHHAPAPQRVVLTAPAHAGQVPAPRRAPLPSASPPLQIDDLPLEAPAPAARSSSSDLPAETLLVDAAERALSRGDAEQALRLGREHARRFPAGQLRQAREMLVTRALGRLGRTAEAHRTARALLAEDPSGLYAAEARRAIGEP